MALYIVRAPIGKYLVFDDLELSFIESGLLYGEAAVMVMAGRGCSAGEAMELVWRTGTHGVAIPIANRNPGGLTLDAILWAIDLICGRPALARELRAIACPCYAPASLDVAVSDDLAELCEAYGIAIPVSKVPEERRVTGNAF